MENKRQRFVPSFIVLLGVLAFGGGAACSRKSTDSAGQNAPTLYHCAMHPQVVSDKPGECPICHMRLTSLRKTMGTADAAPEIKPILYRNPMDPSVTSPVPMKDGMGMAYIPVYPSQGMSPSPVSGQAAIHIEPGVQQELGVSLSSATRRDLSVPIRAAARVAYDPQLYTASLEHQEAAAFLRKAKAGGSADLLEQAESTVASSELRLRQMGLSEGQISEIEKPGYNGSGLLLGSKGGKASIYASVYDYDANLIRPGQSVELTSPSNPGQIFDGVVKGIDPILNADTRTLRVRIEIPHASASLRPETYLSATIHASLGSRLAIPVNAVVDTGARQLVYVEKEAGTFEPREVRLGHRAESFYEVLSGLVEGERVVASANFLIDSESRIQAATQKAIEQK